MRQTIIALALFITASIIRADCTGPNLSVNAADGSLSASFDKNPPALNAGDQVSLAIGDTVLETKVVSSSTLGSITIIALEKPADAKFQNGTLIVDTGLTTDEAQLNFKDASGDDQSVKLCLVGFFSTRKHSVAIGPTMAQNEDDSGTSGDNGDDTRPSAIRLQYETSFRRFVQTSRTGKIPSMRLLQQEFAVSIDTTDEEGKDFIDDNRVMAGIYTPRMTVGNAINRIRFGLAGQHAREFHGDNNNSDITLALDGWIPLFQAVNIGSRNRRLASPLRFYLSAGKRWQDVDDVSSDGDVAEGSLLYHLYLLNDYRLDLEYKTIFNDVDNRPASTPRTQHTWKATVLFMGTEDSRFNVVASYEDGHSGPVFSKLRQFFVGIGLKNGLGSILPQ
jgi:hypothetical protein